jgi:hypothetical protein
MVILEVVAAGYLLNEHRKKKREQYRLEADEDLRRRGLRTPEERLAEEQQRSLDGNQSHLLPPNSPYPPRSNSVPPPGYMPANWPRAPYSAGYQQPPYQPMQPGLASPQPLYPPSQHPPLLQSHHSFSPSQYGGNVSHSLADPHAQYSHREAPGNMNAEEHWKNHQQPAAPHGTRTPQDRRDRSERRARTPPPRYGQYS